MERSRRLFFVYRLLPDCFGTNNTRLSKQFSGLWLKSGSFIGEKGYCT
jgi:hypothetical protein